MTIRISLGTVLVALVFAVIGAGVSVGLTLWEPWDGGKSEVGDFFSMTLETNEDFKEAAQRIGELAPEFDCAGEFDETPPRGTLACDAGLTGFSCTFRADSTTVGGSLVCDEGEQFTDGFPVCSVVQQGLSSRQLIRCSDPDGTDVVCEIYASVEGAELTCQRA